jgi:hypothetical protein
VFLVLRWPGKADGAIRQSGRPHHVYDLGQSTLYDIVMFYARPNHQSHFHLSRDAVKRTAPTMSQITPTAGFKGLAVTAVRTDSMASATSPLIVYAHIGTHLHGRSPSTYIPHEWALSPRCLAVFSVQSADEDLERLGEPRELNW